MQFCRDKPAINAADDNVSDFNANNTKTDSSKLKEKITGKTGNDGTKSIERMLPLNLKRLGEGG